ncbi:sulfite exporter TauE/SafE family protein [Ancylomarina salipaludis]|uniref:Probable membrane transporter protein n=1 Tax=Ancylomarina salipaludis TaxID=2501299 RepID=A0A4V1N0D2_9BACT|nr:sulfite exporter TauE/SafE family protein [Ancylomarina salipaludis]RXQ96242.1 sulfite exporter TauE/SafE family protein [Ancylomarina salipaludis]
MAEMMQYLQDLDIYSWPIIILLIGAGFMVGFINTLAGSGTVISYSLFMFLGLSAPFANGTIRLGVIMQTLSASLSFRRQAVLDVRRGLFLALPTVLGSVLGAQIAVKIDKDIFETVIAVVMLIMGVFIFLKPQRWLKGVDGLQKKRLGIKSFFLFFLIGIYGGFIHIGVGIFLLAALVLQGGYDLVKANALKVFIVFLYSPFALLVFMLNGQVHYGMGLIASVGNIIGGLIASYFAVSWGANFVRWLLILIILLFSLRLLGFIDL